MITQYTCCAITLVNIGQSESQALLDALCAAVDNLAGANLHCVLLVKGVAVYPPGEAG